MTLLSKESIQSIFTLRYDKYSTPFYPHKTLKDFEPHTESSSGWAVDTQELLEYFIYANLNQYDNIGISLSGGIDSTLLLALIRKVFPNKNIEAVHDSCSGEFEFVKDVAERYEANLTVLDRNTILEEIPLYVAISGEPRWNVYHHAMTKLAEYRKADCLVTGDGGDELFGGYVFRYKQFQEGQTYMECHRNDYVPDQSDLFIDHVFTDIPTASTVTEVMMNDYNGKLMHDLLPVSKKISDWYGMPIISPIMDLRDWATHIPMDKKYNGVKGKLVLRDICRNLDLPVVDKKIGYSVDIQKDYNNRRFVYNLMFKEHPEELWNYVNPVWFTKNLDKESLPYANKYMQILALSYYLKQ